MLSLRFVKLGGVTQLGIEGRRSPPIDLARRSCSRLCDNPSHLFIYKFTALHQLVQINEFSGTRNLARDVLTRPGAVSHRLQFPRYRAVAKRYFPSANGAAFSNVNTANPPCASFADGSSTRITGPSLKTFMAFPWGSIGGRKISIWTATARGGLVAV
jgi:hypothetical protein